MPSDATVSVIPRRADDRSSESMHVRAKVILSHVAWLLGMRGLKELGDVQLDPEGYRQRFQTASGTPVDVTVGPVEPADVRVFIGTKPPSRFSVDTIGEDGKTMDVSVLSQRISDGVRHLASALQVDQAKRPVVKDDERNPNLVHRSELNPNAHHGGRPSKSVATRPDAGQVTRHVRETFGLETPVGRRRNQELDGEARPKVPTQVISMMTNLMVRMGDVGLADGLDSRVRSAIDLANRGDVERLDRALRSIEVDVRERSKKGPDAARVLSGIAGDVRAVCGQVKSIIDRRKTITKSGEKNSDLDRLRAIAKDEGVDPNKSPFSTGGTGKAILSRNRGLRVPGESRSSLQRLRAESVPQDDAFSKSLSPEKLRDFQSLFREVLAQMLPDLSFSFRFNPNLRAWSVSGGAWACSFRTEVKPSGRIYGWSEVARKGIVRPVRVDVYDCSASSHDDLAIKIAQRLGTVLRDRGMAKS